MKNDGSELVKALEEGIEGLREDRRNLSNKFKGMPHNKIKTILDAKRNNLSILCSNFKHNINIGSVIRNCNAFCCQEVIIYGLRTFHRPGAVGCQNYENIRKIKKEELNSLLSEFDVIVGIENNTEYNTISLPDFEWDEYGKILVCFGAEDEGLRSDILERCHFIVSIPQIGSVRSLGVACASSIVLYDYIQKTGVI